MKKLFIHDFGIVNSDEELKKIQDDNPELDSTYVTICCVKDKGREYIENLWTTYAPYAEPQFLENIRKKSQDCSEHSNFHDYSWQMYLGSVLLSRGFALIPNKGAGPDIQIRWKDGKNLWIECATTNPGECVAAAGFPSDGDIYKSHAPRISRITNSLLKKYKIFKEQYEGKFIKDEPFVVAINGNRTFTLMPERVIQEAVLERGNDVLIRGPEGKFQGGYYEKKEVIQVSKESRELELPTNYFCNDLYKEVSAVIYCEDHIIDSNNFGKKLGENLYTVFNRYAKNSLSSEEFKIGKVITMDEQGGIKRSCFE